MKKYYVLSALIMMSIVFSYCSSTKKATASVTEIPKLNYTVNVQPIIAANCAPCHIPAQQGKKMALDTYLSVSTNIDDIIRRIELNPTDKGFMPLKHPKLSDSTIAAFKQWKSDGLPEN